MPKTITPHTLLEVVLIKIRERSIKFSKVKKGENEKKMAGLKDRLEVAKINADRNEVEDITAEIDDMTELELREQLDKRRNFVLFDEEKPTARFLKLEKAQGYSEVTRLRIPNKYFNPNLPEHNARNYKYLTVTNQERIRLEMKVAFQADLEFF